MLIGVISDTHGNRPRTEQALERLSLAGIGHLIHCGDLGGEDILSLLFELREGGLPVTAVPGNVDEWEPSLILYAKKLSFPLPRIARLEQDGLHMAVYHGHDPREWEQLHSESGLDVLFTGHTHEPRDERAGALRILNPGAIHRARSPGYALFDTQTQLWTRKELPL